MKIVELAASIGNGGQPMLYLDMDDTLVDFHTALAKLMGISTAKLDELQYGDTRIYDALNKCQDDGNTKELFANLDWLPSGKKLVSWIRRNRINFSILSKPLYGDAGFSSVKGKEEWLRKNGFTDIPAYFVRDKSKFAVLHGHKNVLVDDLPVNVDAFNDAGGIGILFTGDNIDEVIEQLRTIL
jgi:hypothetical protein